MPYLHQKENPFEKRGLGGKVKFTTLIQTSIHVSQLYRLRFIHIYVPTGARISAG